MHAHIVQRAQDRQRIVGIVLVAAAMRGGVLRRQNLDLDTAGLDLPRPGLRARPRLDCHRQRRLKCLHEPVHRLTRLQALAQNDLAARALTRDLKHGFGQIDSYGSNIFHGLALA